jgi:hypothetical protein
MQYVIQFEPNVGRRANTLRVVFAVLIVLPAIRPMMDKLEEI